MYRTFNFTPQLQYSPSSSYYFPQNSPLTTQPPIIYSTKKLQNINCITEPTSTLGGIYLGDIICILKPHLLSQYRITAILSCLPQSSTSSLISAHLANLPSHITIQIIPAHDSLDYPINIHFDQTYQFIDSMISSQKNILIHCHAGISRSAAILCAYLIRKNQWSLQTSINYLKHKRNRVKPNDNFLRILKNYQCQLFKSLTRQSSIPKSIKLKSQSNINIQQDINQSIFKNSYSNVKNNHNIFHYHTFSSNQLNQSSRVHQYNHNKQNIHQNYLKYSNLPISPTPPHKISINKLKNNQNTILTTMNNNIKYNNNKIQKQQQNIYNTCYKQPLINYNNTILYQKINNPWELNQNIN